MAQLQPDSSWLQESSTPLEGGTPAAVSAQAPAPSAPQLDPVIQSWKDDPQFATLPASVQSRTVANYAQEQFSAQPGFKELPPPVQQAAIQNFVATHLEGGSTLRLPVTSAVRAGAQPQTRSDQALRVPLAQDTPPQDVSDNPNPFQDTSPAAPAPRPVQDYRGPDQGFTPQQSAMYGPQARRADDQAQTFQNPNLNPAVAAAGAASLQKEQAQQTQNDQSLTQTPQHFGPEYTVSPSVAGQVGPEGSPERMAYQASAVGTYLVNQALAGFSTDPGKFFESQANKAAAESGLAGKTIGGIDVLGTLGSTARMTGEMGLIVPSGMAAEAAISPIFSLLQESPSVAGAAARSLPGQVAQRVVTGAATGAIYSLPLDPKTAAENIRLFAAFEGAAAGLHILGAAAAPVAEQTLFNMTKNVVRETGAPDVVYIDPRKIITRQLADPAHPEVPGFTPEEAELFQQLGLNNADVRRAMKEGLSIQLPTQSVLTITDKPYWAKVKDAFGLEPTYYTSTDTTPMKADFGGGSKPDFITPTRDPNARQDLLNPAALPPAKGDMSYANPQEPASGAGGPPAEAAGPTGEPVGGTAQPDNAGGQPNAVAPVGGPGPEAPLEGTPAGAAPAGEPIVLGPAGAVPGSENAPAGYPGPDGGSSESIQPAPVGIVGEGPGPEGRGPLEGGAAGGQPLGPGGDNVAPAGGSTSAAPAAGEQPAVGGQPGGELPGNAPTRAPGHIPLADLTEPLTQHSPAVAKKVKAALPHIQGALFKRNSEAAVSGAVQKIMGHDVEETPAIMDQYHALMSMTPKAYAKSWAYYNKAVQDLVNKNKLNTATMHELFGEAYVPEAPKPVVEAQPVKREPTIYSKEETAHRKEMERLFDEGLKENKIYRLYKFLRDGYDPKFQSAPDKKGKDYVASRLGVDIEDARRTFGQAALEGLQPGMVSKNGKSLDSIVEEWGLDSADEVLDAMRFNVKKAREKYMDGLPRWEPEEHLDEVPFGEDIPEPKPEPKKEEPIELTEPVKEPWEQTIREFAGPKPSPPQIVGDKTVTSGDLKTWNAKRDQYNKSVEQAYRDGKLTLDEVRTKTPEQWLKLKNESPAVETPPAKEKGSEAIIKAAGLKVESKLSKKGTPYFEVSGKTYDNKDALKAAGAKFGGKVWRLFDQDSLDRLADELEKAGVKDAEKKDEWDKKVGGRGLGEGTIGIQVKSLRQKLDRMPSIAPATPEKLVAAATRALIQKGEGAIPQPVLDAQVQDIGKIVAAYNAGKSAFVLASDPGMGKTFVIAGALREIGRANPDMPLVWVTQNRRLISQIQDDIKAFDPDGRIQFLTYTDMSQIQAGKKSSSTDIDGAAIAWDEGHSVKNTSDVGEESGAARADLGQKYMGRAKFNLMASATPFENPTQMGYIAASGVFDQLKDMTGLRRAISGTPFSDFALAFGAGQRKIKIKGGREKQVLEWERGKTPDERRVQNENAMAARNWLDRQGMLAQREMKLEPGMVTTSLNPVPPTPENVDLAERFATAMETAIENAGDSRVLRRNLAGYTTNTLKRVMEDAKVPAAIEEAKLVIAEGKQAVIFVETRAKKEITGRDWPAMQQAMQDWSNEAAMMGDGAGYPPYSRFQLAVAEAMHTAGLDEGLESTVKRITDGLGADKVAIFTGDRTEAAANKDLDSWLDNKKPVLIATMAKGGTGLSLHSRRPGDPERVLIGLNMPWTATTMKQVLGRVTRLGMLKPSEVRWLFLDHPFEQMIAAKVGGRMQDMGAVVSGKIPEMGQNIEAFDFDAPNDGGALESVISERNPVSGEPTQHAETPAQALPEEPTQHAETPAQALPEEPVTTLTEPHYDVAAAMSDPQAMADLAKDTPFLQKRDAIDMARYMAEGVAFDRPGFDMEPSPYGGLMYSQEVPGGRVVYHETDGKLQFEPDTEISYSRVKKDENRAKIVTDPRLIKRILSKDILNQAPARTVVSELFQNAIDAFLENNISENMHIEVGINYVEDNFQMAIRDNGPGMTKAEVLKKYLSIGAQGKSGTNTVGGYGMAKVAFLFYPESVHMRTTKNGRTTEINATRDEFMDGDFPISERDALPGEEGTLYLATMPQGKSAEGQSYESRWGFEVAIRDYAENTQIKGLKITTWGISSNTQTAGPWGASDLIPGSHGEKYVYTPESLADMPHVTPSVEVVDGKNHATVHFIKTTETPQKTHGGDYIVNGQVYSKGMPLPALKSGVYDSIEGIGIPQAKTAPKFRVAIDFGETHKPEHAKYPFLKNRTMVLSDIGRKISQVVVNYVEKLNKNADDERVAEFRDMIKRAPMAGGVPVLIPRESYSDVDGAAAVVAQHQAFFEGYGKLLAIWKGLLDGANMASDTQYMISLDRGSYGWHAPNGLTNQGQIIAINPLTMLTKGEWGDKPLMDTDDYRVLMQAGETMERILGSAFTHTALHENVHNKESGHSEAFTSELANQSTLIGHLRLATMEAKATKFYKEFADEIEAIAGDLDRVREGGDAASGSPGPDVDASRVQAGGIQPVDRAAIRAAQERAVETGGERIMGEQGLREGGRPLAEGFSSERATPVSREEIGADIAYDPLMDTFLFDKKVVMPKERVLKTAAGLKSSASQEWRNTKISVGASKVKAGKVADTLADDARKLRELEDCLG